MPPLGKSSYSLHGRFTGSILLLGLTGWSGVAYGSELEADVAPPPESSAATPEIEIIEAESIPEPVRSQQGPESAIPTPRLSVTPAHTDGDQRTPEFTADEVPALSRTQVPLLAAQGLLVVSSETRPTTMLATAPEADSQAAPVFTPAAANVPSGMQVPWYVAQELPPSGVPALPMAPPGEGGAYYPAIPYPGGMWMMVWIPYGAPPPNPSAMPAAATTPWAPPVPGSSPSVPSGSAPGYWAGGIPQGYPGVVGVVPWGSPYGVAPDPYGVAPGPYGVAPTPYGVVPTPYGYGVVPQPSSTTPPYAQANPAMVAPLEIPTLPSATASMAPLSPPPPEVPAAGAQASLPPIVPGTYLPSDNSGELSTLTSQNTSLLTPEALAAPLLPEPNLDVQGLYILQGDSSSARARLSGDAFLNPNFLVGGTLDLVTGPDLTNQDGVQLTELYLATAVPGVPGLRFRLGQLDLTSYFDRNSFSKDISRDFFNPLFHTNPALIAGANVTSSHVGGLMQWLIKLLRI